jgi:hypothetical protein
VLVSSSIVYTSIILSYFFRPLTEIVMERKFGLGESSRMGIIFAEGNFQRGIFVDG